MTITEALVGLTVILIAGLGGAIKLILDAMGKLIAAKIDAATEEIKRDGAERSAQTQAAVQGVSHKADRNSEAISKLQNGGMQSALETALGKTGVIERRKGQGETDDTSQELEGRSSSTKL